MSRLISKFWWFLSFTSLSVQRLTYSGRQSSMRGVQKVCKLTQLAARYAHHILSLFKIDTCNWNALGPAFLQRSDYDIEELLFLVFQPAICHAIQIRMANTVGDRVVQSWNFGWQPVLGLTCDQVHCPGSKWLNFLNWKNSWKDAKFLTTRTYLCQATNFLNAPRTTQQMFHFNMNNALVVDPLLFWLHYFTLNTCKY